MNSAKLREWLELFGIFGVIASLVFVGLELRQSQQIAIANTNLQRTDTFVQLLSTMASDPAFRSASSKARSGDFDSWTADETTAFYWFSVAGVIRDADTYWQYSNGFVPEERWLAARKRLKTILANNPSYRAIIEDAVNNYSTDFQQVVNEILSEIDAAE